MTTAALSSFDLARNDAGTETPDHLIAAATAATTDDDPTDGVAVIVVRPEADDRLVVAASGTSVLRAAVSVAVHADNHRLWRDAPIGETAEMAVTALPEVIAAAADAAGVRAAYVGRVQRNAATDAVAIWFETAHGVARADHRRMVLDVLATAADAEAIRRAELAEQQPDAEDADAPSSIGRHFDPDDPDIDALTGFATRDRFEQVVDGCECTEAAIVVIDLDDFDHIGQEWGDELADRILRTVADRIAECIRRDDVIGRLGHHRLGVLLTDTERSTAMHLAKRLLAVVAEPLPVGPGPDAVTATMALDHQSGLIDLDEMMEAAERAVSGNRASGGRLVLAA